MSVVVKVMVKAGSRKESFTRVSADSFTISVREEAKGNLANKKVVELLARHFGVTRAKVRLITGHRSPRKRFEIL